MAPTAQRRSAQVLNATVNPIAVPVRDAYDEKTSNIQPPNPKTDDLRGRWEIAGYPFQPPSVDDLAVNLGQDLRIPPQHVQDFLERSGLSADEYYSVNRPAPPEQRARHPLTKVLDKVTYGKLFPTGFPVEYNTATIRASFAREELEPLLNIDAESYARAIEARELKHLFKKGKTRTENFYETEELLDYGNVISDALDAGQPVPMWDEKKKCPLLPRQPRVLYTGAQFNAVTRGVRDGPFAPPPLPPRAPVVASAGTESSESPTESWHTEPEPEPKPAKKTVDVDYVLGKQDVRPQDNRSLLFSKASNAGSSPPIARPRDDESPSPLHSSQASTEPPPTFSTPLFAKLYRMGAQRVPAVEYTKTGEAAAEAGEDVDNDDDLYGLSFTNLPLRPPTPPRRSLRPENSTYGPPPRIRPGLERQLASSSVYSQPGLEDLVKQKKMEDKLGKSDSRTPGLNVTFSLPPRRMTPPSPLQLQEPNEHSGAETSWLRSPTPTRSARTFSPLHTPSLPAVIQAPQTQPRTSLALATPRTGAEGPQTRMLQLRTAKQVREGVRHSYDLPQSLKLEIASSSPMGKFRSFFERFHFFRK